MSHVGVKRLRSRNGQNHSAEENERDETMVYEKTQAVPWIRAGENLWGLHDLAQPECPNHQKPDDHDGPEYPPDIPSAVLLEEEKACEYDDCQRKHEVLRLRSDHLEAFHGAQHGNRRSDHSIAVQQRGSDQSQRDDDLPAKGVRNAPLLLKYECQQRENSAFAVVVRPHDEDDVLDADDDYQRPDDQRENAIDVVGRRSDAVLQLEALAQRVQRTGTDVAVDDAERENCEFC